MPNSMNPAVHKMIAQRKVVWVIVPVGQPLLQPGKPGNARHILRAHLAVDDGLSARESGQLPGHRAVAVGPVLAVAREHPRRAAVEAAWGTVAVEFDLI
jgi:hypothetical protein